MRVLILAQYFPPDMGGGATRAYNVAKGLMLQGCEVVVVAALPHYPSGDIPKDYRWQPLKVECEGGLRILRTFVPPLASEGLFKRVLLFFSFVLSSLFALPFVGKVDVVWAANPNVIAVFPSTVYSLFERCPVVQNVDDLWPEELYNLGLLRSGVIRRVLEFVSWVAYRLSATITPVSPAYVDMITNRYEVDVGKVHIVPAGVDLDLFRNFNGRDENREKLFKVLYIGALSLAYDFDYVLKAAELLASDNGIRFVIQGQGDLGDSLQVKVREIDLQNVDVVLKAVSRVEVARMLNSADALLLPLRGYDYTGISSKLYEYQASGKPIICCSRGEPARLVSETRSGIVIAPGDFEGLAKAILYLHNGEEAAERYGEAGRNFVEANLSLSKVGSRMTAIFEQAIIERRRFVGKCRILHEIFEKAR